MTYDDLIAEAVAASFEGWDFSRLRTRAPIVQHLPWSYPDVVAGLAGRAARMLDMGTGGGEALLRIPARAEVTIATEAWGPNVLVAGAALRAHGIPLVQYEPAPENFEQDGVHGRLPFRSECFDVIANRHESFFATEVRRALRSGGTFVTQQVDFHTYDDFYAALGIDLPDQVDTWLPLAVEQVEASGMTVVDARTGEEHQAFGDIGALVWYLSVVSWAIPEFDVAACDGALRRIHERMQLSPVVIRQRRLLVVATS